MSEPAPMKIVSLSAENVKRLRAVEIKPTGALVEIAGRNGQGKSSVLDAMWWALAGTKHIQAEPIRDGAEEAKIVLDLGEFVVRRTFKRKTDADPPYTTNLRVESADGGSLKQPQTILDAFLDALTFDPLEFERMAPKDQFDALRKFVPEIDFDKIDAQQRGDMERRRDVNRDLETKRRAASVIDAPDDFVPMDEDALADQLANAADHNSQVEQRRARRLQVEEGAASAERSAAIARKRHADLIEQAAQALAEAERLEEQAKADRDRLAGAEPLPDLIDVSDVRAKLQEAKAHNARGARAAEKKRLLDEAAELQRKSDDLTRAMQERDEAKRAAIAKAKLPVEGLSFGEGRILFDGHPFEQASDAARLRASIAIAMASNSRLRVVRVRDGSRLDDDAMKLLAKMAAENDCQVWIERVGGAGPSGFVIEDGEVRHD